MFPIRDFVKRFEEILAELDALADACGAEAAEDLEDLNAELEDALLLVSELKMEDGREELSGALEDLEALAGDYRALADDIPGLDALAERLERVAETALGALKA